MNILLGIAALASSLAATPAGENVGIARGHAAHAALVAHGVGYTPIAVPARRLTKLEKQACFNVCMDGEALTNKNFEFCEHSCY